MWKKMLITSEARRKAIACGIPLPQEPRFVVFGPVRTSSTTIIEAADAIASAEPGEIVALPPGCWIRELR